MKISEKLQFIIFSKLWSELKDVKVYYYNDDYWIINKEKKTFMFKFETENSTLYWNHDFFSNFFVFFSMNEVHFEPILVEFAQEFLENEIKRATWEYDEDNETTVKIIIRRFD